MTKFLMGFAFPTNFSLFRTTIYEEPQLLLAAVGPNPINVAKFTNQREE
jgi:hypothetical protein